MNCRTKAERSNIKPLGNFQKCKLKILRIENHAKEKVIDLGVGRQEELDIMHTHSHSTQVSEAGGLYKDSQCYIVKLCPWLKKKNKEQDSEIRKRIY